MVCESPASASRPKGASRIRHFKNHGRNFEDLRKRQVEMNVELRKLKKEDHLSKRRNLNNNEAGIEDVSVGIEDLIKDLEGGDGAKEIASTHAVATLLNRDHPPIDALISIIPKLIDFLGRSESTELQFNSAWALTSFVVCATSEQTKTILDAGGEHRLINLLASNHLPIVEQAVLALGSLAGDCHEIRDHLIDLGVVELLLKLITSHQEKPLKHIIWSIGNFMYSEISPPKLEVASGVLASLTELMQRTNEVELLVEICRAITHLADGPIEYIQPIVDAGVIPHLVRLLHHADLTVVSKSLRTLGNVLSGSDSQTDCVLAAGVCPPLAELLQSEAKALVKDAAWTISNIAAGSEAHIQALIEHDIVSSLINLLSKAELKCQKQAAWGLGNVAAGGNAGQVKMLLSMGAHTSMGYLLKSENDKVIIAGLDALEAFLIASQKIGELESVVSQLDETGVLNRVDSLQSHNRAIIYEKAGAVFEQCFNLPDDEDSELAPSTNIGGNYEFNRPAEAPAGGFSL